MKILMLIILFVSSLVSGLAAQGKLEVRITNLKEDKGSMKIALFNNETDFLKKSVRDRSVKVSALETIIVFEDLPAGEYALSVFHDVNENGELDKNFMGIPKEGFAFGNNSMGAFGPPSFEKAKVKIDGERVVQEISLRHM